MNDVTYRPYRPQDADDVKRIINEAFYIHRYVKNPRLLSSALEVYLRERLLASTYTQVAICGDRVVGLIMGQIVGQPRLSHRSANRVAMWGHMLNLAVRGFQERKSLLQYLTFDRVYGRLRGRTSAPLTDELTLFAVASATRGLGVGKALYLRFLAQLRDHGRADFYLYTDSLCTYGFYEKQGMVRAASEDMRIYLDGKPETLSVYLYTGEATPA